jgi:hypothetical protein
MSQTLLSLAGFQVIISGRFWVIAEEEMPLKYRNEIELSARLMMTGGRSTEEVADFTPEARPDDLAA